MSLRIYHEKNPPNPYHQYSVEWLGCPPVPNLKIYLETAKKIVSENDSPDIPFRYSINPYRGCFHGCAYCYARPSHQYLDFGAGSDFERKLVVKTNAPELLRQTFLKDSWNGDPLIFSGNTDCYQPLEASYQLTRRCLEICREFCNPVRIITKGALIRRDIPLLAELAQNTSLHVSVSIPFSDEKMARIVEPFAPSPKLRFQTIAELSEAGIPVGVGVAPVIPGLNEQQIPQILENAKHSGADTAFFTLLRLPLQVKETFLDLLIKEFPTRYSKVLNAVKEKKNGRLNQSKFGKRFNGQGPRW